ncbi:WhiB family transcriptional regulator [Actinomycetospora straminea]|uniref:4Fe-4S Wbl-type domain-containing protein n=1 Tax=Actinomycetospora straminea TaxID=663607 RepID=A0ABP9F8E5_9PSEU|nr:WhiB family transcriptional regulator [Actinomycetospora straminea]MDD7934789.1 WhiB family transcriptional regulator [Actinomycetospora straminea]
MADSNWRGQAACRGVDPELFFPESSGEPLVRKQVAAAKAVCRVCLVRDRCLADALLRLPHGIAGGLTEQERRRVRSADSLAKADTPRWQALLDAGRSHPEIAHECGVTVRTVDRWVSRLREEVASGRGDPR